MVDLEALLGRFGPLVLFVAAWLETLGLPIPSEATMVFAGSLAGVGYFPLWQGLLASSIGGALGSTLSYWLGHRTGTGWILRLGRRFGLKAEHLAMAEDWLQRRGHWALFLGRYAPFVRALIGYPAGMAGVPFGRYLLLSVLGYGSWAGASQLGGYLLGEHWYLVLHYTEEAMVIALVLAALWFWWHRRSRSQQSGRLRRPETGSRPET